MPVASTETQRALQRLSCALGGLPGPGPWGFALPLRPAAMAMVRTLGGPLESLPILDVVLRRIKMSGGKRAKNGLHKFQLQWKRDRNVSIPFMSFKSEFIN